MISTTIKTIQVPQHSEVWLNGTLYYDQNKTFELDSDQTTPLLIYLHGGGLIYGTRNDLPKYHMELFVNMGYQVLCLDYPLFPSITFDVLLDTIEAYIRWICQKPMALRPFNAYDLFGRSAGSYLAFKWTEMCIKNNHYQKPRNLIAFYGYPTYNVDVFNDPQMHKNHIHIPSNALKGMPMDQLITDDPLLLRAVYYAYLRQEGKWLETLFSINVRSWNFRDPFYQSLISRYDVDKTTLSDFPNTFMAASVEDDDVPFSIGKQFSKRLPNSVFHQVYGLPHDFDKHISHTEVKNLLHKLMVWLQNNN